LRLGWSLTTVGYFFAYVGILITLVQGFLVRRAVPRLGEVRAATLGFVLLIAAFALLASGPGLGFLMLITIPLTVGFGLLSPSLSALLSRLSPVDSQGTVMGLYQSINSLGRVFGPSLGGFFFATHHAGLHGPVAPFVAACIMLAPAMLLLLGYVAPRHPLRAGRA
jgi:DHA1 family tetracycline resistance protein-like MFS transporter